MTRKVEVLPYDSEWPLRFAAEKVNLAEIFRPEEIRIEHIGSTSIKGMAAKPIIDILAKASDREIFEKKTSFMRESGYLAYGENGIAGRHYFVKYNSSGGRLVHLHCYKEGDLHVTRHLAFRDYLNAHPEEAHFYSNVKQEAAKRFPEDIEAYIRAKNDTIKAIEHRALNWYRSRKEAGDK